MLPQEKLTVFIVLTELSFSINRLSIGPFIADLEIKITRCALAMGYKIDSITSQDYCGGHDG